MIEFASEPDPIFLAIVDEALPFTAERLYPFRADYRPSRCDLSGVDEDYESSSPSWLGFSRANKRGQ